MRKIFFLPVIAVFSFLGCRNQEHKTDSDQVNLNPAKPIESIDQSPMDMAYYPSGYPLLKMKGTDTIPLMARVIYSRPHKKGRKIFGESADHLCAYGRPWRLGANESTEIEFFRPVIIANQTIEPGRYAMYCIPYADKWTIVLNKNLYSWGLDIQPEHDVLRTDIPVIKLSPELEDFTMVFVPSDRGAELLMAWDDAKTLLHIQSVN